MAFYPSNPIPRFGSSRGKKFEALRSQTEGGYTYTRKKFTRPKAFFDLDYKNITYAEYATLENFFLDNQGSVFQFTHPIEGVQYNCVFVMDEIKADDVDRGFCSTKIQLTEV